MEFHQYDSRTSTSVYCNPDSMHSHNGPFFFGHLELVSGFMLEIAGVILWLLGIRNLKYVF